MYGGEDEISELVRDGYTEPKGETTLAINYERELYCSLP